MIVNSRNGNQTEDYYRFIVLAYSRASRLLDVLYCKSLTVKYPDGDGEPTFSSNARIFFGILHILIGSLMY